MPDAVGLRYVRLANYFVIPKGMNIRLSLYDAIILFGASDTHGLSLRKHFLLSD
jgi:spore coat polysaccharide biosynthesis predicted glycosyltransferase SpsG